MSLVTASATATKPAAATASREATAATASPAATAKATTATASQETAAATTATKTATATAVATSTATGTLLLGRLGSHQRSLGKEPLQRQQLVGSNEKLVALLERLGLDALAGLDGEEHLVQRPENLVHLAHLGLVLEVDGGVEVGDLGVDQTTHNVALAQVHEQTHLQHGVGGPEVLRGERSAATAASKAASASVHGDGGGELIGKKLSIAGVGGCEKRAGGVGRDAARAVYGGVRG